VFERTFPIPATFPLPSRLSRLARYSILHHPNYSLYSPQYKLRLYGRYICSGNATRFLLLLQTDKLVDIVFTPSDYRSGCHCPNCADLYGLNRFCFFGQFPSNSLTATGLSILLPLIIRAYS